MFVSQQAKRRSTECRSSLLRHFLVVINFFGDMYYENRRFVSNFTAGKIIS